MDCRTVFPRVIFIFSMHFVGLSKLGSFCNIVVRWTYAGPTKVLGYSAAPCMQFFFVTDVVHANDRRCYYCTTGCPKLNGPAYIFACNKPSERIYKMK